jgi:hypothetical protein
MTQQPAQRRMWVEAIGWILLVGSIAVGLGLTIWAPV